MEPTKFEGLTFIWVSKQTLSYPHKHKRPLITRQKGGAKVFFNGWLEST